MLAVVPYGRPVAGADPLPSRPLARLEPEHGIYFGVNLDWSSDSAAAFSQRLGLQAAVYVQFVNFPFSNEDVRNVEGVINQVSEQGGIAVLTLQPVYGLAAVTPESAEDLAQRLDIYNRTAGVPVIVRFAHACGSRLDGYQHARHGTGIRSGTAAIAAPLCPGPWSDAWSVVSDRTPASCLAGTSMAD